MNKKTTLIVLAAALLVLVAAGLIVTVLRTPDASDETPVQTADAGPGQEGSAGGLAAADKNGDGIVYQSGMHPWIVQDEPGQCPICGMDLQPVPVSGQEEGTVRIDPVTQQNIGVRTSTVEVVSLPRTARTTGRFEASEEGQVAISPKISGWVERLHVKYEGARVRKGEPLFELYSPELVSTQEEYLLALRSQERLAASGATADAQRLVDAARRRLAYWDITDEQVRCLEETGEPQKTLTFYAPATGTVTETSVTEGQQVQAGQTLLRLTDLSTLWLMADVYEQDLAWVDVGTPAEILLPYAPGEPQTGRVSYLYDQLDPQARTVQARIAVSNPGGKLKPGMYATVTLTGSESAPRPVVPEEAVIRTGEQEVVVLALGDGRFRPVEVVAGPASNGQVQILEGLEGGEEVVTSAQFLIDSEARLASTIGAMMSGQDGEMDHSQMNH